jgi:hypothetical protein
MTYRRTFLIAGFLSLAAGAFATTLPLTHAGSSGAVPVWQYNFAATNALPGDGSVSVSTPSLGGLVTDSTGALTFAGNNLLTQSNALGSGAWSLNGATLTGGFSDPGGGTNAWQLAITSNPGNNLVQPSDINGWGGSYKNFLGTVWVKGTNGQQIYFSVNTSQGASAATLLTFNGSWQNVPSSVVTGTGTTAYFGFERYNRAAPGSPLPNVTFQIYGPTLSAVTYETTLRPQDQVITQGSAYYGPKFDYGQGLRIWEQRTNLFLNSAVGVTQNVTTTANTYTLSMYGTGSIALGGTGSGTLTGPGAYTSGLAPASLTFAATAGTLTLAVTGSATYVNLEQAAFAGPRILTGSVAVTASADSVTLNGAPAASFINQAASAIFETGTLTNTNNPRVIAPASSVYGLFWNNGNRAAITSTSSNQLNTLSNLPVKTTTQRIGGAWDTSGRSIVNSGVGLVSDSINNNYSGTVTIGNTSSYPDGYIRSGAIYNNRLPNSVLTSKSIIGAPY